MKKIIYLFLILFIFVGCSLNVAEGNSYDTSEQKNNIELCGLSNDVEFYVNFPVNGNEIVRYKCYCDAKDGSFRFWDKKNTPNDFSKYIDTLDDRMLVIPYNDCGWCLDETESKSQMTDCCIKLILNRSETAVKTPAEYGSYELYYSTRVQ